MTPGRGSIFSFIPMAMFAIALCVDLAACSRTDEAPAARSSSGPPSVALSPQQLRLVSIETLGRQDFAQETAAVGYIDFDEDTTVQVFPPYQGKIVSTFVDLGDTVRKGQPLYTIESPDLMAASSTLIAADAAEIANRKALDRASRLRQTQGVSEQSLEQAVNAEATSNAALQAARAAIAVYGKSAQDIIAHRKVDSLLVVRSPISGKVIARNAQPGLLVQPGAAPAPFAVGDTAAMWVVANASETDAAKFHVGQPVEVSVSALPDRTLTGRIETIAANVDPNTHTVALRATVRDPQNLLRDGMLANFAVRTGATQSGLALPADGVVREGDGTLTAWVTTDRQHFTQRVITVGLSRDGVDQILTGLRPGEQVVTKGAVFLDNMLSSTPDD